MIDGQGRLLPQAVDLEEAVLGALMLEKNAVADAIDILKPESFYKPAHVEIYDAIFKLHLTSEPIDILSVTNQLRRNGKLEAIGGPAYIAGLTNRVASAANIEYHARIIQQKYMQRALIERCTNTIKEAFNDQADIFDLCDSQTRFLEKIYNSVNLGANVDKQELIKQFDERNAVLLSNNGISGIPTGFMSIDKRLGGYQPGDLIIIAARPSMGKTALLLELALNACTKFDIPSGFFSLEMPAIKILDRGVSSLSGLRLDQIQRTGSDKYDHINAMTCANLIGSSPFYIDDTPALKIHEFRSKARKMKIDHGIKIAFVDYLQLMVGEKENNNRDQEIGTISRGLKQVAKELDIPVVCLSQLSRAVETRGGEKKPQLSDLRESGNIEQDADIVKFIYRPEYYNFLSGENGEDLRGVAQIIVAKNRNGPLGEFSLKFDAERAKFRNIEDNYFGKLEKDFVKNTASEQGPVNNSPSPNSENLKRNDNFDNEININTKGNDDDVPF